MSASRARIAANKIKREKKIQKIYVFTGILPGTVVPNRTEFGGGVLDKCVFIGFFFFSFTRRVKPKTTRKSHHV